MILRWRPFKADYYFGINWHWWLIMALKITNKHLGWNHIDRPIHMAWDRDTQNLLRGIIHKPRGPLWTILLGYYSILFINHVNIFLGFLTPSPSTVHKWFNRAYVSYVAIWAFGKPSSSKWSWLFIDFFFSFRYFFENIF